MSKIYAEWLVELNAECPKCKLDVNLLDYVDFWDGRKLDIAEHDTERSKGIEVVCPSCYHNFEVDLTY